MVTVVWFNEYYNLNEETSKAYNNGYNHVKGIKQSEMYPEFYIIELENQYGYSYYGNRLHDISYAKVFLRIANSRGNCLEDTLNLVKELYEYIIYLYSHIEQLEKDKRYLLEQNLKNKQKKE